MTIELLQTYSGRRTREQTLLPGVYDDDDPRLFGLADYLVANGYARRQDAPPASDTVEAENLPPVGTPTPSKPVRRKH